ncbi:hypothetical protein [Frondihabitans australicus]|uniref:DUF4383 domain-containing protein n=1 Tax=Frondihabitans australicus TaxID=386892 RepID=A0A495IGB9_9MICO|nr:hypothetical protein [Frondihabitans australicus]RKR75047.1 hypothetical protein C8E83_2183 [Frondihabitans australicus]
MNTPLRRGLLAVATALGLYVGLWAELLPRTFYTSFPGLGLHWIDVDGAYDEHLIRDVGSFYLAVSALSIVALLARTDGPGRLAGLAWGVFGVLHFGYHVTHPEGSAVDVAGTLASLAVSPLVGLLLVLPSRRLRVDGEATA